MSSLDKAKGLSMMDDEDDAPASGSSGTFRGWPVGSSQPPITGGAGGATVTSTGLAGVSTTSSYSMSTITGSQSYGMTFAPGFGITSSLGAIPENTKSTDLPDTVLTSADEHGQKITMTFDPESNIDAFTALKLTRMMLASIHNPSNFWTYGFVTKNNLERHFRFSR